MIHIEFDLNDQWEALKAEFSENEWTIEDGLRYFLASRLRAIQNDKEIETKMIENFTLYDDPIHQYSCSLIEARAIGSLNPIPK